MKTLLTLSFLLVAITSVSAQQTAREKMEAGIRLVDAEKFDDAIPLLKAGVAMEPANWHYAYELAFAYYRKQDFRAATAEFEKVVAIPGADAQCHAMLGNCYDYLNDSARARLTYLHAVEKFPESGHLWVELGNLELRRQSYDKALQHYERGIRSDPRFAPSYYRAAKLLLGSNRKTWGMIYGEAYMNLDRNSARTAEMSKMLFDTYRQSIHRDSDTSISVSFEDNVLLESELGGKRGKLKLPFAMKVYEPTMLLASLFSAPVLDLNGLVALRKSFLEQYYKTNLDKEYPNELLRYQKQVTDAGHADAYHRWILMKGDEEAFGDWARANKPAWDAFVKWFGDHQMALSTKHALIRD